MLLKAFFPDWTLREMGQGEGNSELRMQNLESQGVYALMWVGSINSCAKFLPFDFAALRSSQALPLRSGRQGERADRSGRNVRL